MRRIVVIGICSGVAFFGGLALGQTSSVGFNGTAWKTQDTSEKTSYCNGIHIRVFEGSSSRITRWH